MAKFNVVQKRRRAAVANQKRQVHGDPSSRKLHQRTQPLSISGKRKRKLLKKWRRDQKAAVEKGLITMQDVEMAVADGDSESSSQAVNKTTTVQFSMKKSAKIRVKQLKRKGKGKKKSQRPAGEAVTDSMVE